MGFAMLMMFSVNCSGSVDNFRSFVPQYKMALHGACSINSWIYDSISFVMVPPSNLTTEFAMATPNNLTYLISRFHPICGWFHFGNIIHLKFTYFWEQFISEIILKIICKNDKIIVKLPIFGYSQTSRLEQLLLELF